MEQLLITNPITLAMKKVGDDGRYQIIIIIIFAVMWFECSNILIGGSFIFMNPVFKCHSTGDQLIDESQACSKIDECYLINDYTIVGHLKLYCDRQTQRSIVQSFLPIGSIISLICMNTLCDIKGRKFAIISCLGCGFFGFGLLLFSTYLNTILLMILAQMLIGFGGYSPIYIGYVIYYDICSPKMRQSAMIIMNIVWGATQMLYFFWDRYFHQWDLFIICIIMIPSLVVIILIYALFVECPNFLFDSKKDYQSCIKSLKYIGKMNQKSEQEIQQAKNLILAIEQKINKSNHQKYHQKDNLAQQKHQKSNDFIFVAKKLLFQWYYLKPVLILTSIYFAGSIYYYGVQYSIDDIGYSYSVNMIFLGSVEAAGFIILRLAIKIISKTPRKLGMGFFYGLAGFLSLITFIPFIRESKIAVTIIIAGSRLCTTLAYGFFIFIQTESFTSDIQATGAGIIGGLSQLGSFACPYIIQLLINLQVYPLQVMAIVLILLVVIPTFWLRQTVKIQLQKTQNQKYQINESSINEQYTDTN